MIDLSPSGLHVAIVLDDLRAAGHHLSVGRWRACWSSPAAPASSLTRPTD